MNIHIGISTFDRPDGLQALLKSIEKEKGDHNISVYIYDDCSPSPYQELQSSPDFSFPIEWYRFVRNNGKKGYWRVIDRMFQDASQCEFDYFFLLQDDCILTENFFDVAIEQWDKILDQKKATFCTFTPQNVYQRIMWGGRAKDVSFRGETYINGNYVDCIFMCPFSTLKKLSFQINPVPVDTWDRNPNQSSGVGMQLTKRLSESGLSMYTAYSSLVLTGRGVSKMNKEERIKTPLLPYIRGKMDATERIGNTNAIFVGIASIPKREKALKQALQSLTNQVDKIFVALNGYTKIPAYASEFSNVEFMLTDNSLGDANKFIKVDEVQGYYFSCDDDIVYPKDYVEKMIKKLSQYGGIITCHARTIIKPKIRSFYRDTQQHHFMLRQYEDIRSHIPGTGVCMFHTDQVPVSYNDFKAPNMADIWLGVFAKENNIPVTCIERQRRWLNDITIPDDKTIYNTAKNDDKLQVSIINSIKW